MQGQRLEGVGRRGVVSERRVDVQARRNDGVVVVAVRRGRTVRRTGGQERIARVEVLRRREQQVRITCDGVRDVRVARLACYRERGQIGRTGWCGGDERARYSGADEGSATEPRPPRRRQTFAACPGGSVTHVSS